MKNLSGAISQIITATILDERKQKMKSEELAFRTRRSGKSYRQLTQMKYAVEHPEEKIGFAFFKEESAKDFVEAYYIRFKEHIKYELYPHSKNVYKFLADTKLDERKNNEH